MLMILGVIAGVLFYAAVGPFRFAIITVVLGAFVLPRGVLQVAIGEGVNDITSPNFVIYTYTAAVFLSLIGFVIARWPIRLPVPLIVAIFGLIVLQLTVWDFEVRLFAGTLCLITGLLSWPIGAAIGERGSEDPTVLRFLAKIVAIVMIVELGVSILQLRGVALPTWLTSAGRLDIDVDSRVYGTLGHPANMSKIILLGLFVLLACAASKDRRTKTWAYVGAATAFPAAALTISRANTIAIGMLIFLWVIAASRGMARGLRQLLFVVLAVCAVAFYALFADRFLIDPNGGARPLLLQAGLKRISETPVFGIGPNNYINVVGKVDASTALGYPVHNTVLLLMATVGIPLTILILWPHARLVFRAIRLFRESGSARLVIFGVPGMLLVTMTGWAMGAQYLVVAWYFVGGFLWAMMGAESHGALPGNQAEASSARLQPTEVR